MKNKTIVFVLLIIFTMVLFAQHAEARGRYGSFRVGGYTNSGKGSRYIGGYVRTTHTLKYYLSR